MMERHPRLTLDYSMSLKGWELRKLSDYHELYGDELCHVSTRFQAPFLGLFQLSRTLRAPVWSLNIVKNGFPLMRNYTRVLIEYSAL